jgi:hypothetical protein
MPKTAWPLPNLETIAVKSILRFLQSSMSGSQGVSRTLAMRGCKPKIAAEILLHELGFVCRNNPEALAKARGGAEDFLARIRKGTGLSSKFCSRPSLTADTSPPEFRLARVLSANSPRRRLREKLVSH